MTTRSYGTGIAFGAAFALGNLGLGHALGESLDVFPAMTMLGVFGFFAGIKGLWGDRLGDRRGGKKKPRILSPEREALVVVAVATLLASFVNQSWGPALAALGASPAAPAAWVFVVRVFVATLFVVPTTYALGRLAEKTERFRQLQTSMGRPIGAFAAGFFTGVLGIFVARGFGLGLPFAGIVTAMALLGLPWIANFANAAGRSTPRSSTDFDDIPDEDPGSSDAVASPSMSEYLLFVVVISAATTLWGIAAPRIAAFATGHLLGGVSVELPLFLVGCVFGSMAAVWLPDFGRRRALAAANLALILGAGFVLLRWTRFDEWVPSFLEWSRSPFPFEALLENAVRQLAPRLLIPGVCLGVGATLAARALPAEARLRSRVMAFGSVAFGAGALIATSIYGAQIHRWQLDGWLERSAAVIAALSAVGLAGVRRPTLPRTFAGLVALVAIVLAIRAAQPADRHVLQVERDVASSGAPVDRSQKNWMAFEEDGPVASAAIAKRGHSRRLLVDGRYEVSNESVKSHGVLAHLPLLLHPAPANVVVLGSGNGIALSAALSHPVDRVVCFETDRTLVRATARMGGGAESALRDPRLRIAIGDFEDLLGRTKSVDVILSQVSGPWTSRSSKVSTFEYLSSAKRRLGESGLFCQLVPGGTLTKEGVLTLLATHARVFAQIQVWAGEGGDILVLSRKTAGPIDMKNLLERFRGCECAVALRAAWAAEPLSLLSNFLVSDSTVREITRDVIVHERRHSRLGREEASRRRKGPLVDPVPGFVTLDNDIMREIVNPPAAEFETALRQSQEMRRLEREGIDLESKGQVFDAVDRYQRAIELNPYDGSVRRSLAALRTRMGIRYVNDNSYLAAHNNFRAAVEADTTYVQGFANLGTILEFTGPKDYALSVAHQVVAMEPDNDLGWILLGAIRKKEGNLDEAVKSYQRALDINPRNVEAVMGMVDAQVVLTENPDLAAAVSTLQSYLKYEPKNGELTYRIAKYADALERRAAGLPPEEAPLPEQVESFEASNPGGEGTSGDTAQNPDSAAGSTPR